MSGSDILRGFIYLVDLSPVPGSGATKPRPALVVQNDTGNSAGSTTIVAALSSHLPSEPYPFHVALPSEVLGRPGVILCEQICTVAIERLDPRPLAECPAEVMSRVGEAVRHSLGLSQETGPTSDP